MDDENKNSDSADTVDEQATPNEPSTAPPDEMPPESSNEPEQEPEHARPARPKLLKALTAGAGNPKPPPDAPFKVRLKYFLREKLTRKEYVIGAIVFVLLLGGAIAFGLAKLASAPSSPPATPPAAKQVIVSPLTGSPVSAADAKRPVTGVMIENSDFARPQSGLKEAGVVFEAIAEGGITRFLALYQEAKPANMGPIRSARPYFVAWALGFDAGYSHVGGSPEALADINKWHVKNLDEFYNGAYYHRISSREAPHNMYTSMAELNALEKTKGWTTSHFSGFLRKKDSPSKTQTATTIDFAISGPDYYVHYQYDPKHNAYLRWEGGAPHKDATTGKQLEPKVVIGMVIPYSLESDGYHSDYRNLGFGKAYVFQDGTVTIGTWHKGSRTSALTFTNAQGQPLRLNAGQTWLTALASASEASYHGSPAAKPKQ